MAITPLELLKKHVRADDFDTDDEKLQVYLDAAEEQVIMATNRTAEELVGMGRDGQLPASLVQATLLMAASWYDNAEGVQSVQMHEMPYGVSSLVKPFVKIRRL